MRHVRRLFSPLAVGIAIACIGILCVSILYVVRLSKEFTKETGLNTPTLIKLLIDGGSNLKSTDNRTNIALLGMAGGSHDGPDLTDTIVVTSFDLKKQTLAMISVPRDIWSDSLKDKINSAYHYGEAKKEGGGITLSRAVLEDVVGFPIHYVMTLDFSQFESVIDALGGIDVNVTKGFTDKEFPIAGKENDECGGDPLYACRYETVAFTQGSQHMDGSTALKYVRSRNAEGDEGTDFARGKRQQDIIVALKDTIIDAKIWFHPSLAKKLLDIMDKATDTDMTLGEQLTLGKYAMKVNSTSIQKISIEPLLMVPPSWVYGRYVLVPEKDFASIHAFIQQEMNK